MSVDRKHFQLGFATVAIVGSIAFAVPGARADVIYDPLHGQCNGSGVGTCIDNGTNTPLGNSTTFNFTISPGPQTGNLFLDVLVPSNDAFSAPSITEISPATTTKTTTQIVGTWTTGDLSTFLSIDASPNNPIGAFLPWTDILDPGATGFNVFQVSFGTQTISANAGSPDPVFDVISGLPLGSYIVAFCSNTVAGGDCTVGGPHSLTEVATANSGALLVDGNHFVPEPASLAIFGTALAGFGLIRRRRRKAA